ncbi:hypothetical protein DY000_02032644 [Brassica cretica]|uniref:Uncharacterized protein n=1 Tax=Brassica cretica TaxID=69181 RepID=A0ABQ7DFV2_BRACR|nr:hypothetical protein DY000_02032644 [Brassica cretica]
MSNLHQLLQFCDSYGSSYWSPARDREEAQQNHSSSTQGTPAIPSLLHHTGVGARKLSGHGPQSESPCPGPLSDLPRAVTSTCDNRPW